MQLRYKVRYFEEDEWWIAEIPDVARGTVTQGKTLEEARRMARDAVTQLLLSQHSHGEEVDPPTAGRLRSGWEWVHPDPRVELAWQIRRERQRAGLSMEHAASKIGVAYSTYQRWEDPERCNATISTLDRIARSFGRQIEVAFT